MSPLRAAGGQGTKESMTFFLSFFLWLTTGTVLKLVLLLSGLLYDWRFTWLLGVFSGWTDPSSSLPAKMWCFVFLWDFKGKVMSHKFLIYFHFSDGDRQFSSLKLLVLEYDMAKSVLTSWMTHDEKTRTWIISAYPSWINGKMLNSE